MACACLFLATKLEESPRRTRDILMVFDRVMKRREGSRSLAVLIPETKVSWEGRLQVCVPPCKSMHERVVVAGRRTLS